MKQDRGMMFVDFGFNCWPLRWLIGIIGWV